MKYTIVLLLVAAHFNYLAEKKERITCLNSKQAKLNLSSSTKQSLFYKTLEDTSSPVLNVLKGRQCQSRQLHASETADNLISIVRHAAQLQ